MFYLPISKKMKNKWIINQAVTVVLVSLIFLSFQSTTFKGLSTGNNSIDNNEIFAEQLSSQIINNEASGDSSFNYYEHSSIELYNSLGFKKWNKLNYDVFEKAYKGYLIMKSEGMISNSRYLTVMDFELSSAQRRMWVLDLVKHKIVVHDLVSHGRNSGEEYARSFSNQAESFKSSLGFYVTGTDYIGKNDFSLRLHGVEEGFNDNAFDRGIVMHGADYVNSRYIRSNKRLGRSQGCPAVSEKINKWVINIIEGGSCLFIYYPDKNYLKKSELINSNYPVKDFYQNM